MEGIIINDDIRVVVISHKGNQYRVGIEAPKSVIVHREEIYAKILEEREQGFSTWIRPNKSRHRSE